MSNRFALYRTKCFYSSNNARPLSLPLYRYWIHPTLVYHRKQTITRLRAIPPVETVSFLFPPSDCEMIEAVITDPLDPTASAWTPQRTATDPTPDTYISVEDRGPPDRLPTTQSRNRRSRRQTPTAPSLNLSRHVEPSNSRPTSRMPAAIHPPSTILISSTPSPNNPTSLSPTAPVNFTVEPGNISPPPTSVLYNLQWIHLTESAAEFYKHNPLMCIFIHRVNSVFLTKFGV